ncbi:MAG: terminase, partial [Bryobacteraceae bacterium]
SFYIFDEASAIPDVIWEVAEGGLTDGEPMFFAFGNPTRSSGKFYRVMFGGEGERWHRRSIDSRTAKFPNKETIAQWVEDYGEDSDFVRVRVRGLPPAASELQFIDSTRVYAAQKRQVEVLDDEPLIAGFDVSGGGSAWNVIRFRRGLDAKTIPPIRIAGEHGRDRSVLIAQAAEVLRQTYDGRKVAAMFVDSAFGAPIVERLHTLGFDHAIEVSFGGPSADFHQANQRAYMWTAMKDWLLRGAIDSDSKLEIGLTAPGYHINRQNKLVLESKQEMAKRGAASPDDGDALALTFAQPVAPRPRAGDEDDSYAAGGWMS